MNFNSFRKQVNNNKLSIIEDMIKHLDNLNSLIERQNNIENREEIRQAIAQIAMNCTALLESEVNK